MPGSEFGPVFRRSNVRITMKPPAKKKDTRWTMVHYDKGKQWQLILNLKYRKIVSLRSHESRLDLVPHHAFHFDGFTVEGVESSSSVTFELGKPYTQVKEDDVEETTVCDLVQDNTLLYRSKVPTKVK